MNFLSGAGDASEEETEQEDLVSRRFNALQKRLEIEMKVRTIPKSHFRIE